MKNTQRNLQGHQFGLIILFLMLLSTLLPMTARGNVVPVRTANADTVLKPGDIMFKLISDKSPATSWGIAIGDSVVKELHGKFSSAAAKGDAKAVHVVMYVGNGQFAEAHGGDGHNVTVRSIDHHAGFLFYVYRASDAATAQSASLVASRWANGRMKYKNPLYVPFRSSSYGPFAKKDALRYGKDAHRAGGPAKDDDMFCSEFVIAAYQAAIVDKQLTQKPKLDSGDIKMPYAMQLDASNASPLVLNGKISEGINKGEWRNIGMVLIQK